MGSDSATATTDPARVVDSLVGAIKSIAADPNYNLLVEVFNEVLDLRTKTSELINTNRNVFEQYWQFRNELEEAQTKLERAKAALQENLACKVKELADMTEAHDSLSTELIKTKSRLRETTSAKLTLEANLESANTDNRGLCTTIASLEQELDQVTSELEEQERVTDMAEAKNAALQVSLSERDAELEKVKTELQRTGQHLQEAVTRGAGLQEILGQAQSELSAKTTRLAELDSYRVVLKEEPEDVFVQVLDNVWSRLLDLVESHFQQDLEGKVLNDASCWNNLRNADALKGPTQIPLPQTNSPVAKAMRIAAILSILSRTLHRYVFRPVYLLQDDEEFTGLLHDVEDDNPTKEEHLRATLLATMPQFQQASAKARAQQVVRDVSWVVQHLLGAIAYDSFCTSLENVCALACTEWQKIQYARLKIEPYFGPPYDDFDWQELPLAEFGGSSGTPRHRSRDSSATRCESRGRGPENGGLGPLSAADGKAGDVDVAVNSVASKPAVRTPSPQPGGENVCETDSGIDVKGGEGDGKDGTDDVVHGNVHVEDEGTEVDPSDIILVVWPSMAVVENGEQSPITQGLVISKQQARLAYHEVRLARNGHRSNTKRARTTSISSTLVSMTMPTPTSMPMPMPMTMTMPLPSIVTTL